MLYNIIIVNVRDHDNHKAFYLISSEKLLTYRSLSYVFTFRFQEILLEITIILG